MLNEKLGMMTQEDYQACIDNVLVQLTIASSTMSKAQDEAKKIDPVTDTAKLQQMEQLIMHLDHKTTMLLGIVATYEVAKQQAIANTKNKSNIVSIM